jgi:hypothetical protein
MQRYGGCRTWHEAVQLRVEPALRSTHVVGPNDGLRQVPEAADKRKVCEVARSGRGESEEFVGVSVEDERPFAPVRQRAMLCDEMLRVCRQCVSSCA